MTQRQEVGNAMHTGTRLASQTGLYILARPPRLWPVPPATGDTHSPLPPAPADRVTILRAAIEARTALREAALAAETAATQARAVAAELDDVLAAIRSTPPDSMSLPQEERLSSVSRFPGLSAREREVLTLISDGLSNKAIAERLYISPNTVKTHVASLLNKLDAQTRVQLAALAVSQSA